MLIKNHFAQQFAKSAQAATRAAFEVRFNAVQRGLIGQMHKEINGIDTDGTRREIQELQKVRDKAIDRSQDLRQIRFKLISNTQRLQDISERAGAAVTAANADADDTLSEDEAEALNTAKAAIGDEINRLQNLISDLGISDGGLANRLRHDVETLESLTATAGVIDPEGTDPASNDNRTLIDLLSNIESKAAVFASSSSFLVETANQMVIDAETKAFDIEADLTELSRVRLAQREEEVEDIQIRYGNLIRSISLAFEVQSGLGDMLAEGTQPPPDKGSILNLFI